MYMSNSDSLQSLIKHFKVDSTQKLLIPENQHNNYGNNSDYWKKEMAQYRVTEQVRVRQENYSD